MLQNTKPQNLNANLSLAEPAKKCIMKVSDRSEKENKQAHQILLVPAPLAKSKKDLKKAFIVFSNIQDSFGLKKNTLFLAFEIYQQTQNKIDLKEISHNNMLLICLHLAMKYEEIYPPLFSSLQNVMGVKIDRQTYRKLQLKVLQILNFNLNLPLISREVEQQMGESQLLQDMLGSYLLEISIVTPNINYGFSREQVAKAVTVLAKSKQSEMVNSQISSIVKLLLKAKADILHIQPSIFYKYQQHKYGSVAILPL